MRRSHHRLQACRNATLKYNIAERVDEERQDGHVQNGCRRKVYSVPRVYPGTSVRVYRPNPSLIITYRHTLNHGR